MTDLWLLGFGIPEADVVGDGGGRRLTPQKNDSLCFQLVFNGNIVGEPSI